MEVIEAGYAHSCIVVGKRLTRELLQLRWVNTVLGNLKPRNSPSFWPMEWLINSPPQARAVRA